jgi:hypothetical protein
MGRWFVDGVYGSAGVAGLVIAAAVGDDVLVTVEGFGGDLIGGPAV